jgi:hypothetical protein
LRQPDMMEVLLWAHVPSQFGVSAQPRLSGVGGMYSVYVGVKRLRVTGASLKILRCRNRAGRSLVKRSERLGILLSQREA